VKQSTQSIRKSASSWLRVFYWGADLSLLSQTGAPRGHRLWFYGVIIPRTEIAIGFVWREKKVRGAAYCIEHGGHGFTSDCVECHSLPGAYTEQQQAIDREAALAMDLGEETEPRE